MFIAAFFIRAEKQKQPEYLSTDEGKPNVCSVTQSCLTLYNPMNCSPPGFSVHGIFQARILEWVAIFLLQAGVEYGDK